MCVGAVASEVVIKGPPAAAATVYKRGSRLDAPWIGLQWFDYLFAGAVLALLATAAIAGRRPLWGALVRFFTEPGDAVDLAVFRIAVCLAFWIGHLDLGKLLYAKLPKGLEFAPSGLGWLVPHLPLGTSTVHLVYHVWEASIVLTAFGVFTRWAAGLMAVSGAYVFLVPNLFGYVSHAELPLVWFAVLLAASPSGDALSVDALRRAWFSPERVIAHRHHRSLRYSLPLRFTWLLIGLVYIFPGTHKFASAGFRWASSTNLARRVYTQSFITNGWPVAHHLDRHPVLLTLGGLMTLAFEMSFLLLVLFRRTRYLAAVGGIVFHSMTKVLLHISFFTLQLAYVSFVPWQRLLSWVGRRIVRYRLVLGFDPTDAAATRLAALTTAVDVFRTVEIVADPSAPLVVSVGEERLHDSVAVRRLIRRVPVLALFVPVLRLPWPAIHDPRRLARKASTTGKWVGFHGARISSLVLVGSCLTAAVLGAGLASARDGWPFAMFPTFAGYVRTTFPTLGATAVRCDHSTFALNPRESAERVLHMPGHRYAGLVRHLIGPMKSQERRARLVSFTHDLLDPAALARSGVAVVEFTRDQVRVTPPPMSATPVSSAKLIAVPISSCR